MRRSEADSKGSLRMSAVSITARWSTPAIFRFVSSRCCGLSPRPKCWSKESPNRSRATRFTCGRDASTMMDDRPVPAPRSSTRLAPERRKLSVGNAGRPLISMTKRTTRNAAVDHRATTPTESISALGHLRPHPTPAPLARLFETRPPGGTFAPRRNDWRESACRPATPPTWCRTARSCRGCRPGRR